MHALAEQAEGFLSRECKNMAEQREAMHAFEARQEVQMHTMMAQMWNRLTSRAIFAQSNRQAQPDLVPELDSDHG